MDPQAANSTGDEPRTILVIDDDDQVLLFLTRMLRRIGWPDVLQASSREEAHRLFAANSQRISLVISDFVMPCCTGDQLILDLQKSKPTMPALIISGNDPFSLDSKIPLEMGVNFLRKPFTLEDMRRTVQSLSLSS